MTADHGVNGTAFLPSGGLDDSSCYYKAILPLGHGNSNGKNLDGRAPFSCDDPLPLSTVLDPNNNNPSRRPTSSFATSSSVPIPTANGLPGSSLLSSTTLSQLPTSGSPPALRTLDHQLLRRLLQQNEIIRQAWEAERKYLDTNRRRVEQVYQQERVIMDEVCETWEKEKAALLLEIDTLRGRVRRLEDENLTLRASSSPLNPPQSTAAAATAAPQHEPSQHDGAIDGGSGVVSVASPSYGSGTGTAGGVHSPSQRPGHKSKNFSVDPLTLPPGLDGASRRPHFAYPGSSRTSPSRCPEPLAYHSLDPRMQPQTSTNRDFLPTASSSNEDADVVPVIDVGELDPKLEGISLKAPAVQKATFGTNGSGVGSPASPPTSEQRPPTIEHKNVAAAAQPPRDATVQALRAEELRRLTMHAGHTPNRSLSNLALLNVANSSGVAGSDDEGSILSAAAVGDCSLPRSFGRAQLRRKDDDELEEQIELVVQKPEDDFLPGDGPEEQLEVEDEVRLRGPLMIKNIPAQDEIFLDQLNKKLEKIGQGEDALPTVMSSPAREDDEEPIYPVMSGTASPDHQSKNKSGSNPHVGGDASSDVPPEASGANGGGEEEKSSEVERDVPLKLKGTSNFGAPFGVV